MGGYGDSQLGTESLKPMIEEAEERRENSRDAESELKIIES